MGESSRIGWTDHTFNPWWGCTKVSAGCANCYADRIAHRYGFNVWGADADRRSISDATWENPIRWNAEAGRTGRRARVFCGSMCDIFEDRRDLDDHRLRLFDLIAKTPNLDWLLLTKRPHKITSLIARCMVANSPHDRFDGRVMLAKWIDGKPPAHVWIGTSAEDQATFDERMPELAAQPAALRFVSVEPMLAPITLDHAKAIPDWLIIGCESNSGRAGRVCLLPWIERLLNDSRTLEIPVFVKQIEIAGRVVESVGRFPERLRVREYPATRAMMPHNANQKGLNP